MVSEQKLLILELLKAPVLRDVFVAVMGIVSHWVTCCEVALHCL